MCPFSLTMSQLGISVPNEQAFWSVKWSKMLPGWFYMLDKYGALHEACVVKIVSVSARLWGPGMYVGSVGLMLLVCCDG